MLPFHAVQGISVQELLRFAHQDFAYLIHVVFETVLLDLAASEEAAYWIHKFVELLTAILDKFVLVVNAKHPAGLLTVYLPNNV
jgi:hypothetical protein